MKLKTVFFKLKRKIAEKIEPKILGPYRRKKITNDDFTIISNNCWASYVYRYFGLPYNTPTIGLYFFADDFIKFVQHLKYYLSFELQIIPASESKHFNDLAKNNELSVPIGRLDDIEIVFLHYKTPEEAKEKWIRRTSRVNWNNIILKFSQMNHCTFEHLKEFDKLDNLKRIMFVSKADMDFKSGIYYQGFEKENQILDDTSYWNKYINIVDFINFPVTSSY